MELLYVILGILISLFFTAWFIPQILAVSYRKKLFDYVDARKIHTGVVPRLGGIAFVPSILVSLCLVVGIASLFVNDRNVLEISPLQLSFGLCSIILLYYEGIMDDLVGLRYRIKFVVQIISSVLIVSSGVWMNDFHGLFGLHELSPWIGMPLSVVVIVFIINAINFIDGIDGLASGLSIVATFFFGMLFYYEEMWGCAYLSFVTFGTLLPFFYYNVFGNEQKRIYGVQFHPEVVHTQNGNKILANFLFEVAGAKGDWTMASFVTDMVTKIKDKVGDKKVLCAMSGGVDSAVAATLVHRAVGDQLTCMLVDHGLMRKNECAEVVKVFRDGLGMNLKLIDAEDRFLHRLKGVSEPEQKRKIIGEEFIRVFEEEGRKMGKVNFLVQGTIYPDIIESGFGNAALIKSHHNVGGLPSVIDFDEIIEPLKDLFKDEVRRVGLELGLSREIVMRQPFPGPGLGIRVIGEPTKEKLDLLREADAILREEIAKNGLDQEIWQYFAVLTDMRSVGVMGDMRTYDYTLALRAVTSIDAMTADWARIPYPVLETISTRIINECRMINRIVYDITSKPPATIEWE